ncbi:MAG: C45 family peptidase [Ignavibacteria bacterium]|nr:C45 family peptidase [Ignavibacteria bacterium]
MLKKNIIIISTIILLSIINVYPCTTAIISGRITPDGKPLLWKNRDTDELENKLMYFRIGNVDIIGLVNSKDTSGKEIWIGMNSFGFAIMNSVASNLGLSDSVKDKDKEGIIMKLALEQCQTVEDFEKLLNVLEKPMGLETNFGVIDAYGNAAYFETDHWGYRKFDVNDSPTGYLIRTNFAFSGIEDKGQGYERYMIEEEIFEEAYKNRNLNVRFLLQDAARCLKHGLTKVDLKNECTEKADEIKFVSFTDFIPRYSTSASVVVQGVKEGENPKEMIMWAIVGFPPCGVVYPVFFNDGKILPTILQGGEDGKSKLCSIVLEVKDECFPIKRGRGTNYININALYNLSGTGIMQKLLALENEIFNISNEFIYKYFSSNYDFNILKEFYNLCDNKIILYFNNNIKNKQ